MPVSSLDEVVSVIGSIRAQLDVLQASIATFIVPDAVDDTYLTMRQVQALTHMSERGIRDWVQRGLFPKPLKFGNKNRWSREEIEKLLKDSGRASWSCKSPAMLRQQAASLSAESLRLMNAAEDASREADEIESRQTPT